jgi:hypothetical protein
LARGFCSPFGCDEFNLTDDMIEAAISANNEFIARLEAIRDSAQGKLN